jgi:hypothetical protein
VTDFEREAEKLVGKATSEELNRPVPIKVIKTTKAEFRQFGGFILDGLKAADELEQSCTSKLWGYECSLPRDHKGLWHAAHSNYPTRDRCLLAWERDEATRAGGRQK